MKKLLAEFKPTTLLIYSAAGDTARGVMLALINGLVLSLLFGLFGSIPGLVAFPQSAITPVFALLVSNVIILIPGESPEVVAASVLMAVLLATLMVSVAYILLGFRKLGIIIRFMPYPVSGGFLAGLG
jgi:SulP family sulfate permease